VFYPLLYIGFSFGSSKAPVVKYGAEQKRSRLELSGITPKWMGFDNKVGTTLASARALCLDLLSHVWLRISGGMNCCQEFRRGMV